MWRVEKQVGDRVEKGDVLALIDAAEVGQAKSEFLQAIAQLRLKQSNVERLRPLAGNGDSRRSSFCEAEAEAEEARIRLHRAQQALVNLGLPVEPKSLPSLSTDEIAKRIQFLGLPADVVSSARRARPTRRTCFRCGRRWMAWSSSATAVEGEVVDTQHAAVRRGRHVALVADAQRAAGDAKYVSLRPDRCCFARATARTSRTIKGTVGLDQHRRG